MIYTFYDISYDAVKAVNCVSLVYSSFWVTSKLLILSAKA